MDISNITPSIDLGSAKILANQNGVVNNSGTKTEAQIRSSAQGFERILVRQMLSTMRNPNLRGDDATKSTSTGYLELADDNLADLLSKGKGMGFGSKIAEQLLAQANVKQLIANDKNAVNNKGLMSGSGVTSGGAIPVSGVATNVSIATGQK
jgi:Rod binding domain-containing protein